MYLYRLDFLQQYKLNFAHGRLHEDEEFTPRTLYFAQRVALLNIPIQYHRVKRDGAITSVVRIQNLRDSILNLQDLCTFVGQHSDCHQAIRNGMSDFALCVLRQAGETDFKIKDFGYTKAFVKHIIQTLQPDKYTERTLKLALVSKRKALHYFYGTMPRWQCKLVRLLYT